MDEHQERYLAHQARKRDVLMEIMEERHSNRRFLSEEVDPLDLQRMEEAAKRTPSSCDRRGVTTTTITERDDKSFLGGVLVGGVGWIHRAPAIILLHADPAAYKAGGEIAFMPYLDAGVQVQNLYLMATALGLHGAFVNPNIRDAHKPLFETLYGNHIFCGAFAFGRPFMPQHK